MWLIIDHWVLGFKPWVKQKLIKLNNNNVVAKIGEINFKAETDPLSQIKHVQRQHAHCL